MKKGEKITKLPSWKKQERSFMFMTNKISITNDTISADQLQAYKEKN